MRRSSLGTFAFALSLLAAASHANAQVGGTLPPPPPPPPGTPSPPPPLPPPPEPPPRTPPKTPPPRSSAPAPAATRPSSAGPRGVASDANSAPSGARPTMLRSAFGLEAYWWSAKRVESALPVIPFATVNLSSSLALDFHLPLALAVNALGDRETMVALGNPTVGLTYATSPGARWTWFIGGRASAPFAGARDAWRTATRLSSFAMALYDVHYWASEYLPIGARAGVELRPKSGLFFRGLLEPTLFIPLDDRTAGIVRNGRTAELIYQVRVEGEDRTQSGWGGGAGLQLVHAITSGSAFDQGDNAQAAIEPFVSYTGTSLFARLGVLVALDTPLGFGFETGRVAALRLGVGSYF